MSISDGIQEGLKVTLVYPANRSNEGFDYTLVIEQGNKLQEARLILHNEFKLDLVTGLYLRGGVGSSDIEFIVRISEILPSGNFLEEGLLKYMQLAGVPNHFVEPTDSKTAKRVLERMGKTLDRPRLGHISEYLFDRLFHPDSYFIRDLK